MSSPHALKVMVHKNVVIWAGGNRHAPLDVWFHPAFGDSAFSYRCAFGSKLADRARVLVYDPPGHGASPPRARGLSLGDCARLWCDLVTQYSRSRQVVLAGHSMAGLVASLAAARLRRPPMLVIGIEANLTRSDAYFTGLAARFEDALAFHRSLLSRIRRRGRRDEIFRRFGSSLSRADPFTLWTLGRSIYAHEDPGAAFRRLRCPGIYYWDPKRSATNTRAYVKRYNLPNRRLDDLGHWPMISGPDDFYSAIADDIRLLQSDLSPMRAAALRESVMHGPAPRGNRCEARTG